MHARALAIMPFDYVLVFHCNYVSALHRFWDIITYFLKFQDVMNITMPTQGTICHPSANTSHGEQVYKIWSLYL